MLGNAGIKSEHEIHGKFANPSSNPSEGQVWHLKGLFSTLIIAVKMRIGPSSPNLAMVLMALVEHRLLMVYECNAC